MVGFEIPKRGGRMCFFVFFWESLSGFKIFGKDFEDEANAWWVFLNRKTNFNGLRMYNTHIHRVGFVFILSVAALLSSTSSIYDMLFCLVTYKIRPSLKLT